MVTTVSSWANQRSVGSDPSRIWFRVAARAKAAESVGF